ncbi:MAG: hypothetical protein H6686_06430 [Fibrobacteria bacterium]|nr:hypothetical protein [Fibrobacteria bacterium]
MTEQELETLRERVGAEAELVRAMVDRQSEGLARLSEHFEHQEFLALVADKRTAMEALSEGREAMKPLTEAWVRERHEHDLRDPGVEEALADLQNAFEALRGVEDQLEGMATAYLARLAPPETSVEDRILLHRSWT